MLGVTLTIALLAGLWSFQASLRHLLDTPHLYGWNWSVKSGAPALPDLSAALVPAFEQDPTISALARRAPSPRRSSGSSASTCSGIQQEQGPTSRPPCSRVGCRSAPNEMMLGTTTLERAGLDIGDIAVLRLGNTATGLRVVGRGGVPGVR